jgi:D-methionine transport system permease protein
MFENLISLLPELGTALLQTLTMLGIGLSAAVIIGGPLGILLFLVGDGQSLQHRPSHWRSAGWSIRYAHFLSSFC